MKHSCRLLKLFCKIFVKHTQTIQSNTIKSIVISYIPYPAFKCFSHKLTSILIKIRTTSESAVLNFMLIKPIANFTSCMIMFKFVEGIDLCIICSYHCNIIDIHIQHYPNSSIMASLNKVHQIVFCPKVCINIGKICCKIACKPSSIRSLRNRRNHNCIEAHILDIIEIANDSFESASTIIFIIETIISWIVSSGKSISD